MIDSMSHEEQQLANDIYSKYQRMKSEKAPWLITYEWICEYICHLNNSFLRRFTPIDEVLNRYVFDGHAASALQIMASTFVSNLWPNGARSIRISPSPTLKQKFGDNQNITEYFTFVNRTIHQYMDDPKAGLITALEEYMYEQGAYGTSGIFTFEGDDTEAPLIYKVANIKNIYIALDNYGQVDTVYMEQQYSLKQAAQEYGEDKLTPDQLELLRNRNGDSNEWQGDKGITVIIAIEPNGFYDPFDETNKNFPYSSTHIDIKNKNILKRSGYTSMPCHVARFFKRLNHTYGFSPGMNAIPDVFEINSLRETIIAVPEKIVRPPLAVWDASILGGGTVDLSAGAINVYSPSGYISESSTRKPIESLIDIGELQGIYPRITELATIIENHFYKDRLLDLENQARVTQLATSTQDKMRNKTMGTLFARQIQEVFQPMVERSFSILFKKGLLGTVQGSQQDILLQQSGIIPTYIPAELLQAIQNEDDFYTVDFISPAARILQSEEAEGITDTLTLASQLGQVPAFSDVLDNIDIDATFKRLAELNGFDSDLLVPEDQVKQVRQQRQQQQAQQAQLQQSVEGAKAAKDTATAQKMDRGG